MAQQFFKICEGEGASPSVVCFCNKTASTPLFNYIIYNKLFLTSPKPIFYFFPTKNPAKNCYTVLVQYNKSDIHFLRQNDKLNSHKALFDFGEKIFFFFIFVIVLAQFMFSSLIAVRFAALVQ